MITHTVTVRHVVTYEAILTVDQADARQALRAAEQYIVTNPETGKVLSREISATDIRANVLPDPATPATS